MRFRKQISICKGVKLNLSTSGVSCTVGGKGISLNLGKKGVFLNTSLPGTGIYDRKKLIDGKMGGLLGGFLKGKVGGKEEQDEREEIDVSEYELALQENGVVEVLKADGSKITDEEEKLVRRTAWYDQQSAALMEQFREEIEAQTAAFVNLYQSAQSVTKAGDIEPSVEVEQKLDAWLEALELPMSFSTEYEYDEARGCVMMDLDLPEIEDIPDDKIIELASGAIRAKDKSQKEIKEDYRTCVLGLAVYMASHVFLAGKGIANVLISGYTQRRDKNSGELEDCYIFSIAFDRNEFRDSQCSSEDPAQFCDRFRSRINVLASGEMKKIEPYTPEEFIKLIEG